MCVKCSSFTSADAIDSFVESVLIFSDVDADDLFPSPLSCDFRTAPTRSFAKRDHDSIRLCANQHAAGPKPLILFYFQDFSLFISLLLDRFSTWILRSQLEMQKKKKSEDLAFDFTILYQDITSEEWNSTMKRISSNQFIKRFILIKWASQFQVYRFVFLGGWKMRIIQKRCQCYYLGQWDFMHVMDHYFIQGNVTNVN